MKKIIITVALLLSMIAVFASEGNVKSEILSAFKNKFNGAQEVSWSAGKLYTEATFLFNGGWFTASYNEKAELVSISRNISSTQLPYFIQNNLRKNFGSSWITELVEISNQHGFSYYVTLTSADNEVILESLNGKEWTIYKSTQLD